MKRSWRHFKKANRRRCELVRKRLLAKYGPFPPLTRSEARAERRYSRIVDEFSGREEGRNMHGIKAWFKARGAERQAPRAHEQKAEEA